MAATTADAPLLTQKKFRTGLLPPVVSKSLLRVVKGLFPLILLVVAAKPLPTEKVSREECLNVIWFTAAKLKLQK